MSKKINSIDDVERWRKKIAAGLSMRDIAREEGLKPGVVIGRMYRADGKDKLPKQPRKPKAEKERLPAGPKKPRRPDMKRPEQDGPDIIALGKNQCKFPVTHDRPYKFCGAETTNGPYCKHHTELATDASAENEARVDNALKWLTPT